MIGVACMTLFFAAAILAPVIAPYAANDMGGPSLSGPSAAHLFGTDLLGRDVFSRVILGSRQALTIADQGHVLVNGRNFVSGPGRELLANDNVRRSFLGGGQAA